MIQSKELIITLIILAITITYIILNNIIFIILNIIIYIILFNSAKIIIA